MTYQIPEIYKIIRERRSVRRFAPIDPPNAAIDAIASLAASLGPQPFGSQVRFALVRNGTEGVPKFGTYGMISGAPWYLVGSLTPSPMASVDFGHAMEGLILTCQLHGLGTCWLGGTLDRSAFRTSLGLSESEVFAAASPIGLVHDKKGIREGIVRSFLGADNRKPFSSLFYTRLSDPNTREQIVNPLGQELAAPWLDCLLAVQRAPSASNKQPWRLVLDQERRSWDFYLDEDKLYNSVFGPVQLQDIDLGIALYHFAAVANEQKIPGSVRILEGRGHVQWTYKFSWTW